MAKVASYITGRVRRVEIKVGQQVQAGDTLVVLEAMKMEMALEAPQAGRVKEVRCREGQSVNEGDVLVVLAGAGLAG